MDIETSKNIIILSFYCFTEIADPATAKLQIQLFCRKQYLKGTILIAREGFNGSLAGDKNNIKLAIQQLTKFIAVDNINFKVNYCNTQPFDKLKIKLKQEIVTFGCNKLKLEQRGKYIKTTDWDDFVANEDVIMIDTRNNYEIVMGRFKNAINPLTAKFSDLPAWLDQHKSLLQDKKIAMYCTGGVRCEKSTAYLIDQGFNEVYHLQGGILQYLADTNNVHELWQGKCFVFDNRLAVDDQLQPAQD